MYIWTEIKKYYSTCKALIFPGVEDFGIVPLEAMASGRPVIAYGAGGVLDSVIGGETGIFFREQSIESLNAAVDDYESGKYEFEPQKLRDHAETFSAELFENKMKNYIETKMESLN